MITIQANPDYKGVCHVALAQEGHCRPGEVNNLCQYPQCQDILICICLCFNFNPYVCSQVLVGTDSHTCTAGAFGQFATGIGNTDAGFVLGTGKILLKVCDSCL